MKSLTLATGPCGLVLHDRQCHEQLVRTHLSRLAWDPGRNDGHQGPERGIKSKRYTSAGAGVMAAIQSCYELLRSTLPPG